MPLSFKRRNQTLLIFGLLIFISLFLFIAHISVVKSVIWGDGRYYYANLRSAVIDRDFNFQNESIIYRINFPQVLPGRLVNPYSIGPALLWGPFFLAGHLISLSIGQYLNLPASGDTLVYHILVGIGAMMYGLFGLYISYLITKRFSSNRLALLSTVAFFLCTNALFYIALDPVNSHTSSIFIASLLVFLIVKWLDEPHHKWVFLTGILIGFLVMIRTQDAIFLLPIAILILLSKLNIYERIFQLLALGITVIIVFTPQLLLWLFMLGKIQSPYIAMGENFDWLHPKILEVLFSVNNGLFIYSPMLILSVIGLIMNAKKQRLALTGLVVFILELYIIGCWSQWHEGTSYGARMFLTLTPFFILGLANFLEHFLSKYSLKFTILLIGIFALINFASILLFLRSN